MADHSQPKDRNIKRVLEGKYRIDELLAYGGWGVVYRATQLSVARHVAVKLLLPVLPNQRIEIEGWFRREARATAQLCEQHTVHLIDFGVTDAAEPYLVMELLRGRDLERYLCESGPLPVAQALTFGKQILLGLSEAHARGIVHRDLKPSNVFVTETHHGEICIKVMDFGIAQFKRSGASTKLTRAGEPYGTPPYMSPEQVEGNPTDARSDLYTFGIVLFELLTGRLPFAGDNSFAVMYARITTPPRRLTQMLAAPGLPEVESYLDSLLAKNPDQRIASAAAALVALQNIERALRRPTALKRRLPHSATRSPSLSDNNTAVPQAMSTAISQLPVPDSTLKPVHVRRWWLQVLVDISNAFQRKLEKEQRKRADAPERERDERQHRLAVRVAMSEVQRQTGEVLTDAELVPARPEEEREWEETLFNEVAEPGCGWLLLLLVTAACISWFWWR